MSAAYSKKIDKIARLQIFLSVLGLQQTIFKDDDVLTSSMAIISFMQQGKDFLKRIGHEA